MDKDQRRQVAIDLTVTLVTTFLILAIWWIAELPEWKRQALMGVVLHRIQSRPSDGLGPLDKLDLASFRIAVSKYSHGGEE
jgi:hypothetical protein